MKHLTRYGKYFKRGPKAKIYKYLRDNHEGIDTNPIGIMISYLKRMERIKIGKYEASIKAKELKLRLSFKNGPKTGSTSALGAQKMGDRAIM